jgi:WD40 repeat protein/nucleoside phosphorylase
MEILSPALARNAVDKIRKVLKPAYASKVDELLTLLDPDGKVSVKTIHDHMFALIEKASANAGLNRLMLEVNATFAAQGSSARMQITDDKKLGLQRQVWFEAEQTALPQPYTAELDAIDNNLLATDQQATFVDSADIVLLTFNDHELQQCLLVFTCDSATQNMMKNDRVYYRLGVVGGHKVVLLHSPQATIGALQSAESAIAAWQPKAVIAVGIAFGVNKSKQKIGDVLISEFLIPYELARVNPDGSSIIRGPRPPASDKLLKRFKQLATHLTATKASDYPELRFGGLFSGDKLIDSATFLQNLLSHASEAIGGEMEGTGLFHAATSTGKDWIVVKAICDFADGNKNSGTKEQDQSLAASHAAKVVKAMLEFGPLYLLSPDNSKTSHKVLTDIGPERFTARHQDLELTKGCYTVDDAQAVKTTLNKATLNKVESPEETASGMPIQQALMAWVLKSDKDAFALLGEYGMGKTINCQMFDRALRTAHQQDNKYPISLYFDLRHVSNLVETHIPDVAKIISDCVRVGWLTKEDHSPFTAADIERWAKQFGVVLIFDGLDEVLVKLTDNGGQRFTHQLFKYLTELKQRVPAKNIKMLLSCRTQYFPSLHNQIDHFTNTERGGYKTDSIEAMLLLPFNEQQILNYLKHSLPGIDPDGILAMIASVHDLTDLSKRPYTLKLVSELIPQIELQRQQGLSVSGVGLYKMMVTRWLDRDGGKHHISPAHKMLLASHLAAFLWQKGQRALPAAAIQDWFHLWLSEQPTLAGKYQKISADLLEEDLRTATFLSRDDTSDGSRFRFAHSSLQEYFLANYLLQAIENDKPDNWAMSKPSQETLAFLAQLLAEPEYQYLLPKLSRWKSEYRQQVSENLLQFTLLSQQLGFTAPNITSINFAGAKLDDLVIECEQPLSLAYANFKGASLRRAKFTNLLLQQAKFDQANLTQASFARCKLGRSSFNDTNLTATMFYHCDTQEYSTENAQRLHTRIYDGQSAQNNRVVIAGSEERKIHADDISKLVANGHNSLVRSCTILGDGVTLVSTSHDNTLRVWDSQNGDCLQMMEGHSGEVTDCAVLGDGVTLVSASDDCTLRVWDSKTGDCLQVLQGHGDSVTACAVLGDGVTLVSASEDNTLRIWDSQSGDCLFVLEGHCSPVAACTVLGDGVTLVSASYDHTLRVWDSQGGACLQVLQGHSNSVVDCVVLDDGMMLASASYDNTLRIWDTQSGECLQVLEGHNNMVIACAVLGDGVTLVSASYDNTLRVWDSQSGDCLQVLLGHTQMVTACKVLGDGVTLVSASWDKSLRVWDSQSGDCLQVLAGHDDWVFACAVLGDGVTLVSASWDNSLRVWDSQSGDCLLVLAGHSSPFISCTVLGDGVTLVSSSWDNSLRVWDSHSGDCLQVLKGHSNPVTASVVLGDGVKLVSASYDNTLRVWDTQNGDCLQVLEGHCDSVNACAVLGDRVALVSASQDKTLRVWDSQSGDCLHVLEGHSKAVIACAVLGDGVTLVSASSDNTIRIWDSQSGDCLQVLECHSNMVTSCAVLGDGVTLVSTNNDSTLRVWDSQSGNCLQVLEGHSDIVAACAVLGDGVTLVSASYDNTLRVWDSQSGDCLQVLEGHSSPVTACAVLGDGVTLVSVCEDNTLRIWDSQSGDCLHVLEGHNGSVIACALLGDGVRLVSASRDNTLRVWDSQNGACITSFYCLPEHGFVSWDALAKRPLQASDNAWRYMSYLVELNGKTMAVPFFMT